MSASLFVLPPVNRVDGAPAYRELGASIGDIERWDHAVKAGQSHPNGIIEAPPRSPYEEEKEKETKGQPPRVEKRQLVRRFRALERAGIAQLGSFLREFGPLEFCAAHWMPAGHRGLDGANAVTDLSHAGTRRRIELEQVHVAAGADPAAAGFAGRRSFGCGGRSTFHSLDVYRSWSGHFNGILQLADGLRRFRPELDNWRGFLRSHPETRGAIERLDLGTEATRRPDAARDAVSFYAREWFGYSVWPLQLDLMHGSSDASWSLEIELPDLWSALGYVLYEKIASTARWPTCVQCGEPFEQAMPTGPDGRGLPGRPRTSCPKCWSPEATRRRARRKYERTRRGL